MLKITIKITLVAVVTTFFVFQLFPSTNAFDNALITDDDGSDDDDDDDGSGYIIPSLYKSDSQWLSGLATYYIESSFPHDLYFFLHIKSYYNYQEYCIRFEKQPSSEPDWLILEKDDAVCGKGLCGFDYDLREAQIGSICMRLGIWELMSLLRTRYGQPYDNDKSYFRKGKNCTDSHPLRVDWSDPRLQKLLYDLLSVSRFKNFGFCFDSMYSKLYGSRRTFTMSDAHMMKACYNCKGCYSYRYRPMSDVTFYDNLIVAAKEGETLWYPCRAFYNGDLIPGKGTRNSCRVSYERREYTITSDFELLTNPQGLNVTWKKSSVGMKFPNNAIPGGMTALREPLYVGRCNLQIDDDGKIIVIPGKIHSILPNMMYVPYGGQEYHCNDYEVLVCIEWDTLYGFAEPVAYGG